jgi:prepilin-type processing-associated H-X9-DG protein
MWWCPGEKTRLTGGLIVTSYGYNGWGHDQPTDRPDLGLGGVNEDPTRIGYRIRPTKESEVLIPSNMLAIGDGSSGVGTNGIIRGVDLTRGRNRIGGDPDETRAAQERHRKRANVTFCDGHVEGFSLEALLFQETDEALRRWERDNEPHRELLR